MDNQEEFIHNNNISEQEISQDEPHYFFDEDHLLSSPKLNHELVNNLKQNTESDQQLYDLDLEEEEQDDVEVYDNLNIEIKNNTTEGDEEESSSILVMDFRAKESLLRLNL